jgi:MFS family permease
MGAMLGNGMAGELAQARGCPVGYREHASTFVEAHGVDGDLGQPLRIRIRPVLAGRLRGLFAGISAFELGNCAATLLILRATQLLEPARSTDNATTTALWLYVGYNLAATLTSLAAGRYADRTDATRVLAAGVAAFALAYLGFTHDASTPLALLPWFVLAGIGIGCAETAEHAAVATHAPTQLRGSAAPRSSSSPASKASATSPPAPSPA